MRKVLALLLSLVMTLTLLVPATWAEEKPAAGYQLPASLKGKTVILHTNDVHGAIDKYAKVAALKNECYDRGASAVVLLDAGDFSQGSTYVSLSKGATAVELMNAVGYDAVTLGNHEFDYGFPQLKANLSYSAADFLVTCVNLVDDKGDPIFAPGATAPVTDADDNPLFNLTVMGVATPETQTKANPALMKGLTFLSGQKLYDAANAGIKVAREEGNADIVIALTHLGVDASSEPNRSIDFVKNVPDVDIVIDGHSHTVMTANKGTYYVHCTEGKDRAGFVSALLECLMGATYDEVVADYMVTYYNYYGVEPGTDKYEAIANSNIIKTLQNAFGVEDLSKADLQKGAKDYMKAIGLTDAEITDLMVNLGYVAPVEPATPSKPATGDAGIVVYLGLGVMALAGGVLVAKKKEQF